MDFASAPQAQSNAPTFSVATLRDVLAEIEAQHPELGQRPIRAASIVVGRKIEPGDSGRAWYVQSETDPEQDYIVCCAPGFNLWSCGCKDWQQRGGTIGPCKHILAVQILAECERRERGPEPPPIPLPFPPLPVDEPIPYELTPLAYAALDGSEPSPAARCPRCTGTLHAHNAACPLVADQPGPGAAA